MNVKHPAQALAHKGFQESGAVIIIIINAVISNEGSWDNEKKNRIL